MRRWRCLGFRRRLVDYAADTLGAAERARVDAHLRGCAACRDDLDGLRTLPPLLRGSQVPDPGADFWLRQRQGIARALATLPQPRRGRLAAWRDVELGPRWRYAAAIAASALCAVVAYRAAERAQRPRVEPVPYAATLDRASLLTLHEIVQAVAPADDTLAATAPDDAVVLTGLPFSGLLVTDHPPDALAIGDLNDAELDGLTELIGGVG